MNATEATKKPRNERNLASRNQREGEYCGRTRYCKKTGRHVKPHHYRGGGAVSVKMSLKWGFA